MTALNKYAALRQLATDAHELGIIKRYTKGIEANKRFIAAANPATVLALLNELEAAESTCRELSAENAGLKGTLNDILQPDAAVLERNHRVRALDAMETPATDAFLAEVRAQGVESAGEYLKQYAQGLHEEARLVLQDAGELCNGFAAQLREGVAL